ncbi:hypothetical protein, partial [Donghicola sp.]|uniref:hypothetical protein n=1 Tax=Donghicola sp. TaxID=1929294 RepID=UPI0025E711A8
MYRARVTALIRSLGDRTEKNESWDSLRCLIEELVLQPRLADVYAQKITSLLGLFWFFVLTRTTLTTT